MNLSVGTRLHGFVTEEIRQLDEVRATMYRMRYEKNGADLIWLDREDENKTFAISFKTIPQDDTGVFHILEHSVLCGSKKYPVKEPFVDLLKSSLQTFLNAFTFPDKTMYPVCSRNDQDFLNLMDVYLDAVFHPLSLESSEAFRQEGWHYELDGPDGELKCNGVVYNEMKGAYASPDTVLDFEMNRLLFPDNCYGCESGGHPEHITDLTYEQYKASHDRFYHPSNARIFLDGKVDLEKVLARIGGFLQEYDCLEVQADIPMQQPTAPEEKTVPYEIGSDEDGTNKVLLADGWVIGDYADQQVAMAAAVLSNALCSSNEAPVKKALLERGLAENVEFATNDGIQQLYAVLVVRNTSLEKKEEVRQVVRETLTKLAEEGLDHQRLHAILNRYEFNTREKDFGTMPRGLVYAITVHDTWLYGGDPAQNLCYDDCFAALREKVDNNWFEQLIRELFLDNPHHAQLCLVPDSHLGERKRQAEAEHLAQEKAAWSEENIAHVMEEFAQLRQAQERENTPEQTKTLPVLSLQDIPKKMNPVRQEVRQLGDTTLLLQEIDTDGILYLSYYFSLADLTLEELKPLRLMTSLMTQLPTEQWDLMTLRSRIEANLGRFSVGVQNITPAGQADTTRPFLTVSMSLLPHRKQQALDILEEVLFHTKFEDSKAVHRLLRQLKLTMERRVVESGNGFAADVLGAAATARGAVEDVVSGLAQLRYLQQLDNQFDEKGEQVCAAYSDSCKRLFTRERLTLSLTGDADIQWLEAACERIPEGNGMGEQAKYPLNHRGQLGIQIPADIGFAACGSHLSVAGAAYSGVARVAAQILTYGYLWDTIRVKGGAYGTQLDVRPDGSWSMTSYRDPNCSRTLDDFRHVGRALRAFCDQEESIDRYIISTIGDAQPVFTPQMEGLRAVMMYFTGRTNADLQRTYSEMLSTTRQQLREFSYVLDTLCESAPVCVVGGKRLLDDCGDKLERHEMLTV